MNRTIGGSGQMAIGWRGTRLVLAASGLALAGLATSVVPASASPASASTAAPRAGIDSFIFTSGVGHLNGAGHKWSLTLGVEALGGGTGISVFGLQISTPHLGGTEYHTWGGQLRADDLSVSPTAFMTLNSQSSLSPVAALNLTFRPASHKTQTRDCVTGKEVVYSGILKGSVRLNTGLKGLKLRAAHFSFGSHSLLTVSHDCVSSPCHLTFWDTISGPPNAKPFAGGTSVFMPGRTAVATSIQRTVTLPGANRIGRSDVWTTRAKAPTFNKSSRSLSVTSTSTGLVTGAATLAHGKRSGSPIGTSRICYINGTKYAQTDTQYLDARYEASRPFEAHTILNGTVKVKRSGTGRFDIVTLKRK
jgi:hypothetical protein